MNGDKVSDQDSPYWDSEKNRLYPPKIRAIIDKIANDPRFSWSSESKFVAREYAGHLPEDLFRAVEMRALRLFDEIIGNELTRKAEQILELALDDPEFELLPSFGEIDSPADSYFEARIEGEDPRILHSIRMCINGSERYQESVEKARRDAEAVARTIADDLDIRTRDQLVLATRVAEREQLLANLLADLTPLRKAWMAYLVQRDVVERFSSTTADRYSAAAKTLLARGWTKKATASALGISTNRLNAFISNDGIIALGDDDPLYELVPDLRADDRD